MESALCTYLAKERNKVLRRGFRAQETYKNLLQEECVRLKAQVSEVKNTMKKTLKSSFRWTWMRQTLQSSP